MRFQQSLLQWLTFTLRRCCLAQQQSLRLQVEGSKAHPGFNLLFASSLSIFIWLSFPVGGRVCWWPGLELLYICELNWATTASRGEHISLRAKKRGKNWTDLVESKVIRWTIIHLLFLIEKANAIIWRCIFILHQYRLDVCYNNAGFG